MSQQSKESQIKMFGCEIEAFEESVKDSCSSYLMAAASILSDTQEILNGGGSADNIEWARQAMNRAKHLISKRMATEREQEERKFNEEQEALRKKAQDAGHRLFKSSYLRGYP